MIEKLLNLLFQKREIVNCDRDIYLHRWFLIRNRFFAVYIHKFVRSDEDRACHDHPWDFLVIPIWRGYWEWSQIQCPYQRPCILCVGAPCNGLINRVKRVWPILGTRFRRAEYRHRVNLIGSNSEGSIGLPAWSLFIRFRKRRDWGFWLPTGFKQWNAFWQEKCE